MSEKFDGLKAIHEQITLAKSGEQISLSTEDWLRELRLDSEDPDGKTFIERLAANRNFFGKMRLILTNGLEPTIDDLAGLIGKVSRREHNIEEEKLINTIAVVMSKQITREGNICPAADTLATYAFMIRPEYFPEELAPALTEKAEAVVEEYKRELAQKMK